MNLPKVPGTQIRGTTYHFNLPIPTLIQVQHPAFPAGVMRGSLRTSDPKVAASRVGEQRAIFDRQVSETRRLADRDRILGSLGQDDRDLLAEIGGPGKLLDTLKGLRQQAALMLAGAGAEVALLRETTDTTDHVLRVAEEIDTRETQAALTTITAETRRLKRVAGTLGEAVPPPPKGIDEGGEGIRELAEKFAGANSWTIQNRESLALTVRRWIELHGDMPVKKWERQHLDQFDELLTQFPTTNGGDLRKLSIRKIVDRAKRDNLPSISPKTRGRYSDHMKALTKYALNKAGLIQADPFAGYEPRKVKEKFSKQKITTISYTPEQVDIR